jgi:putative MATE family efflux protein
MPMVFSLIANVLNGFGNWILIFGKFGAPELGVVGAGLSTSICLTLQGLMTFAWMHSKGSAIRLRLASYRMVARDSIVRLARVTAPAVVEPLLLQIGFLIFIKTMSSLGTTTMAAHRTAVSVESLAFMPGYGLSIACGAIVGQCLGAKRPDRAEEALRFAAWLALLVMGVLGAAFYVAGRPIVDLLAHDASEAVKAGAAECLKVSAAELPFLALAMVLGGALRGAGDTRSPLIVALVGVWLIRVPLSYVAAIPWKLGLTGAWLTMVVDWAARAGVFWILWKRGRWKTLRL